MAGFDRISISTEGNVLLDPQRTVVLRGFVTITHVGAGRAVNYTLEDYQKMRLLGANYQSIRIFGGNIGVWPGTNASRAYLQRVDDMVQTAKQAGMYSELKLTMYGISDFDWTKLWLNKDGEQDAVIAGWNVLWEKYKDEPAVVGYDLLNEPEKGNLNVSDEIFVSDHLIPYYRKMIDKLKITAPSSLALFQPALKEFNFQTGVVKYLPFTSSLDRKNIVYAPHLYSHITSFDTSLYGCLFKRYTSEALMNNAPLFIGEYGIPWKISNDGDTKIEREYQPTEADALQLFDQADTGFSRPWYADDRAAIGRGKNRGGWSLIKGKSLDGELREFIIDVLVRPYPRRTAGSLGPLTFDFKTKVFTMVYTPNSDLGDTLIFIPLTQQYGKRQKVDGFKMNYNSEITLGLRSSSSSLQVISNPGGVDTANFSWDDTNQELSITGSNKDEGKEVNIKISSWDVS